MSMLLLLAGFLSGLILATAVVKTDNSEQDDLRKMLVELRQTNLELEAKLKTLEKLSKERLLQKSQKRKRVAVQQDS